MAANCRPSDAEIRRALAECMTAEDIDDAMGWPAGTARRRRWRAPSRGGLPFADAELGGVALWFRSTFETWQDTRPGRGRRDRSQHDRSPVVDQARDTATAQATAVDQADGLPTEPVPATDLAGDVAVAGLAAEQSEPAAAVAEELAPDADTVDPDEPAAALDLHEEQSELPSQAMRGPEDGPDDQATPPEPVTGGAGDATSADAGTAVVGSGFELEIGQRVLAHVHGRWLQARVGQRDRGTVAVDYDLDQTPLGARRQRIGIDRVRILTSE